MYITPRYRRPPYGQKEEPETGFTCPICNHDFAWWDEPWGRNEDGDICHEKCLEERDDGT